MDQRHFTSSEMMIFTGNTHFLHSLLPSWTTEGDSPAAPSVPSSRTRRCVLRRKFEHG